MRNFSLLNRREQRRIISNVLTEMHQLCDHYKATWTAIDPSWETIEGAAYIRLSTPDQFLVEKGSVEQQIHIAVDEAVIRSKKDQVNYRIVEFFIELPITGRSEQRTQLDRLERAIGKRRLKFVVIKELARIFRESSLWKKFFKHCQANECEIMIRSFPFNPNDPTQILQLDILAAFAEYESSVNSKRGKESHFSAMISSGKFNSTHKVLGLDQVEIGGVKKVGLYAVNQEEMKVVVWIMQTFLRYGSYQVTLAELEKRGIKNKNGRPFKKHSLHTLLTNTKYIGEWEVNPNNKNKNPTKLMPYERHSLVRLPHGCVIDMEIWNQVEVMVERLKGNKGKNTRLDRIYLLSGLLEFEDGTTFQGTGSWGDSATSRCNYYYNKANKVRLKAEELEAEAKKMAASALSQSKGFQDALKTRLRNAKTTAEVLKLETVKHQDAIVDLKIKQDRLSKRVDFLLGNGGDAKDNLASMKSQFLREYQEIQKQIGDHDAAAKAITDRRQSLEAQGMNLRSLLGNADRVVRLVADNDTVALKNAYKHLFDRIIVGREDTKGSRPLKFLFKDQFSENIDDLDNFVNRTDGTSVDKKLAQEEGLEPPTKRLTAACSTD